MYIKQTVITICALTGLVFTGQAGTISSGQTLQSIAPDAEVNMRSWVETTVQRKLSAGHGHKALIIPPSFYATQVDQIVLKNYMEELISIEYGELLLNNAFNEKNRILLKLFYDVPLEDGKINWQRPMWENDRLIRHELLGANQSKQNLGLIALNNHQSKDVGLFTFTHELFHLLDANNETGDFVDNFLSEYRATLAETYVYLQKKMQNQKSKAFSKSFFIESPWHEELLVKSFFSNEVSINPQKVFAATLDLFYPENPQFKIANVTDADDETNSNDNQNTHSIINRSLIKILNNRNNIVPYLVEFSNDQVELEKIKESNLKKRARIKNYFSKSENRSLLTLENIFKLKNDGFNSAHEGGGTRPSGPGG